MKRATGHLCEVIHKTGSALRIATSPEEDRTIGEFWRVFFELCERTDRQTH